MVSAAKPYQYLLGLGSNLGDRMQFLQSALQLINRHAGQVCQTSHIYETAPFGNVATQPFLNMAIVCESHLEPEEELIMLLKIESQLGRVREKHWGDRTIDLDILAIRDGNGRSLAIQTERLRVPHAHLLERDFALLPAAEVAPDWHVYEKNTLARELSPADLNLNECLAARQFHLRALSRFPLIH